LEVKDDVLPPLDESYVTLPNLFLVSVIMLACVCVDSKLGRPIRWGIIGCGDVTESKSGPAFQKCRGSTLVAVMRPTASLSKDYARRHGVPRYYTQARSLIMDHEVDAVYIATPPGHHMKYALEVAAAGKPCFVEKPLARNADEARAMVDEFQSQRLPLYSAYYRRALPRFVKAKQLISFLGTVTSVSAVLNR
jgi:1,5-anhydro-D-fructose reductase (1,5-anhydro-D-mannitol-forming)